MAYIYLYSATSEADIREFTSPLILVYHHQLMQTDILISFGWNHNGKYFLKGVLFYTCVYFMVSDILDPTPPSDDDNSWRLRTVEVSGVHRSTTSEYLQLFFENPRRSGGGGIDDIKYNSEQGRAIITFKDAHCTWAGVCVWFFFSSLL